MDFKRGYRGHLHSGVGGGRRVNVTFLLNPSSDEEPYMVTSAGLIPHTHNIIMHMPQIVFLLMVT